MTSSVENCLCTQEEGFLLTPGVKTILENCDIRVNMKLIYRTLSFLNGIFELFLLPLGEVSFRLIDTEFVDY